MTITQILITICAITILAAAAMIIFGIRRRSKKFDYDNEQVPMICFGTKIFLKRKEIEKYNNSTRDEKRRALGHFKSAVKKGKILPVYEDGEIVGYMNAENFK
jgi:hypothetical protein